MCVRPVLISFDSGIWCIDVADEYPSAEVRFLASRTWHLPYFYRSSEWTLHLHSQIGISNVPHPNLNGSLTNPRVPPNCRFELDDMERPWMWKENSFDFIFCRDLLLACRDFPKLIDQCYTSVPLFSLFSPSLITPDPNN